MEVHAIEPVKRQKGLKELATNKAHDALREKEKIIAQLKAVKDALAKLIAKKDNGV